MTNDAIDVTLYVLEVLEQLDVPYVIGGSLASTLHGVARATLDSDLIVKLQSQHVKPFVKSLQDRFYVDEQAVRSAIERLSSFNLIHLETMFKVDIFIPKPRPFDRQQIARATAQVIATDPDRTAMMATAEDTILAKLEWYRLGGEVSDRQWRDVLGIVAVQGGRLDYEYLRREAVGLGVEDLLKKALDEYE